MSDRLASLAVGRSEDVVVMFLLIGTDFKQHPRSTPELVIILLHCQVPAAVPLVF